MFRMFHCHIWMNQRFLDVLQFCFVDQVATPFVSRCWFDEERVLSADSPNLKPIRGTTFTTLHLLAPIEGQVRQATNMILGPSSDRFNLINPSPSSSLYIWNQGFSYLICWSLGAWSIGSKYIGNWKMREWHNNSESCTFASNKLAIGYSGHLFLGNS